MTPGRMILIFGVFFVIFLAVLPHIVWPFGWTALGLAISVVLFLSYGFFIGRWTPEWFLSGVEAVLLAPTAVNQQKFYIKYLGQDETGKAIVSIDKGFSLVGYTKMDMGIAKLHFELGSCKENFEWKF